jgi:DNA-binding IclR family transcriptional regulator
MQRAIAGGLEAGRHLRGRVLSRIPKEGRGVQSVEVGIRVLEALCDAATPVRLKDVAKAARVAPAQAHAYLMSFRRQMLVEQDLSTGLYRLGHFALQLAIARMRSFDPIRTASEAILELATETRLTTALSVWGSFGPTIIYIHEGADQIHINTRAGTVYSVTGTATGLAFAAYLPEDLIRTTIKAQMSEADATQRVGARLEFAAIAKELERIRERGYATIDPPPVPEVYAIAAPVFDYVGQIRMVITLIGHSGVIDATPGSRHVEQVLNAARRLNDQMGYFRGDSASAPLHPGESVASGGEQRTLPGRRSRTKQLVAVGG